MQEFQFNCMTTANHLMGIAKRQHCQAVREAHARQTTREAAREYRRLCRDKALNAVLLTATIIGTAVATAVMCTVATG